MSQAPSTQSLAETRTQTGRFGKGGAHRFEHLQRKPQPVFQAAAVLVAPLVGDRRQELVQQIAVRGVDLDAGEPEPDRAQRGGDEVVPHLAHAGRVERFGRLLAGGCGTGEGATVRQPPGRIAAICAPPAQGTALDALRPAWPSWMATGRSA